MSDFVLGETTPARLNAGPNPGQVLDVLTAGKATWRPFSAVGSGHAVGRAIRLLEAHRLARVRRSKRGMEVRLTVAGAAAAEKRRRIVQAVLDRLVVDEDVTLLTERPRPVVQLAQ